MNDRYVIVEPIEGGTEYWGINDLVKDLDLVYIHKSVPNAEEFVRRIFIELKFPH